MRALFFSLSVSLATPAFAGTQAQEAPHIVSDKQQIEDDRAEARLQNKLGLALLKQKKFYEASDAFYEATSLDPDNAHYQNNYGLALLKNGDPYSASEAFRAALELGLTKAFVWNNLGMAYEHTDALDEARNAYLKAAQKGSTSAEKNFQRIKNVKSLSGGFGLGLRGGGLGCGGPGEYEQPVMSLSVTYTIGTVVVEEPLDPILQLIFQ